MQRAIVLICVKCDLLLHSIVVHSSNLYTGAELQEGDRMERGESGCKAYSSNRMCLLSYLLFSNKQEHYFSKYNMSYKYIYE